MAVYYKFKSAKDYDSIPIDGHYITVANLKERIFESKHLGRGTDFDLVVTNAQTNEEYLDEAALIPKNTSVLIRRVPGRPRMPIVTQPDEPRVENKVEDDQTAKTNFTAADTSIMKDLETSEWDDEFGNEVYAIPEVTAVQSSNPTQDVAPSSKADEDSKIKALVESSVLDWQRQPSDGFRQGGRGRMQRPNIGGRILDRKTPPQGYICHRCKVPGHFIQHCPTNGDPNYDIKKVKNPTGIPKSMLVATPDGSYALPSGTAAFLKPNEAAFEKEVEGLPSTRSVGDLPPEFHCALCKEVMKDAVLTSKCCFNSFCDKCIRDYIISKSMCVCGARDILADDLLPNKTLRDTINRILESGNSSTDNVGSALQIPDMESSRVPHPKIPSPTQSAASKGEQAIPPRAEETSKLREGVGGERPSDAPQSHVQPQTSDRGKMVKVPDVSVATHESASAKEPASQTSAPPPIEEEVQQKVAASEAAKKKKKKKKMPLPVNPADMQWMGMQPGMEGFMGPSGFNPYWPGMQPAMDGFMGPFPGSMPPYNLGFGPGPMDMPFGNVMPQDPFGAQGFMFPPMVPPPQRDLAAEFGMNMNMRPPLMSREEFEARKAEVRRKREMERRVESRELPREPRERDYGRELSSSADIPPMKLKPKPLPAKPLPARRSPSEDRYDHDHDHHRERHRDRSRERERSRERASIEWDRDRDSHHRRTTHGHHRSERVASPDRSSRGPDLPRPSLKRKSDHHREADRPDHSQDHHRDRERERDRERKHDHEHERRHHRRSESAKPPSAGELEPVQPPPESEPQASKPKPSVFSRISFPDQEELPSKKRKASAEPKSKAGAGKEHEHPHHKATTASTSATVINANGYHHLTTDYESSDDERHFKRKPSRYEPSPPREEVQVEEGQGRRHRRHR